MSLLSKLRNFFSRRVETPLGFQPIFARVSLMGHSQVIGTVTLENGLYRVTENGKSSWYSKGSLFSIEELNEENYRKNVANNQSWRGDDTVTCFGCGNSEIHCTCKEVGIDEDDFFAEDKKALRRDPL